LPWNTLLMANLPLSLIAERAEWIDSIGTWSLRNYYMREINNLDEILSSGTRLDTIIFLKPSDFIQNLQEMETMNFKELEDFIDKRKT
jgi:lipopolysaccharide export system permease protein